MRGGRRCKFYIFERYLGMSFFQLGVLLGNFEYSIIYIFISCPIAFKYTVFGLEGGFH